MKRTIIQIDQAKCNGCGACAAACQEGAIAMVEGKAQLIRDDYCDGLGNCLPHCPTDAITFVEREAAAFDEEAVQQHLARRAEAKPAPCGCPGSAARALKQKAAPAPTVTAEAATELRQWPVQLRLAPLRAAFYDNAHLLVAADCAAYACGSFHHDFMRGCVTLIGCPKLDDFDYAEKLTAILTQNDIRKLTIVRMEVPCCGGLANAATAALKASGKMIPWDVVILGTDGSKHEM